MARKKKRQRDAESKKTALRWAVAILSIASGVILALGTFGLAGYAGSAFFDFAFGEVGVASFLLPIILIGAGLALALEEAFVSPVTLAGLVLIEVI